MKELFKPFSVLLIGILLTNCDNKPLTLEDVFKEPAILISKELPIEDSFFANPNNIEIIDSLMLIVDEYHKKCFTVIDLKNRRVINRFGSLGRGPNELDFIGDVLYSKDERRVSFTIKNPGRYWHLDIDDIVHPNPIFKEKLSFTDNSQGWFFSLAPIRNAENKYIGSGMFRNGMYGIYGSDGILDTIIGQYTAAKEHQTLDQFTLGSGYQGMVKPNPTKPLVAYVSFRHDLIEVVNCVDYNIKTFHGGNFPDLKVGDNNIMGFSRHSPFCFVYLCTTEKYIYALYSGKTFAKDGGMAAHGNLLYVFDWNLKPIIYYKLDQELHTIKVSEDNQTLYSFALNSNDKMVLMQWRMDH